MQRLGRRVSGRLDARFGPDTLRPRRPRLTPSAGPDGGAGRIADRRDASQAHGMAGQADGLAVRR